jgi:outer membrane lipoprotein SlyB
VIFIVGLQDVCITFPGDVINPTESIALMRLVSGQKVVITRDGYHCQSICCDNAPTDSGFFATVHGVLMSIKTISIALAGIAVFLLVACNPQNPAGSAAAETAAPVTAPAPAPAPVVCDSCGVIRSITAVEQKGEGTGVGGVLGALVGGLAGNQVGGGSGKKIATVAGAIGGAVLGNNIEKNRNSTTYYEIVVDMESGRQEVINVPDATGISIGSHVTVQGGNISLR